MAEMMRKLITKGPRQTEIIQVPIPVIAPNQLLIKLKYMGVCMSEHYDWSTSVPGKKFGHEPMGVVVKVGENVKKFKVGDRVTGWFDDGLQEYVTSTETTTFKVPDNVKDVDAIGEPLACLVSAVSKVPIKFPGETSVAVVGCGYMGCGAIGLLKIRGAGRIVAVDINRESLKNALKYGADEVYTPDELPEEYIAMGKYVANGGFEIVCEWGETEESLDLAIRMTRQCGFLGVGAYHTGGKRLVDVQQLNVKAIDMLSTHPRQMDMSYKGCELAMEMLSKRTWNYNDVPVKVYPAEKFDLAHEELPTKFGKYLKAVIDCENTGFEPYIIAD